MNKGTKNKKSHGMEEVTPSSLSPSSTQMPFWTDMSKQISQVYELQTIELRRRDNEIEQLKQEIVNKETLLQQKEEEIVRLEEEQQHWYKKQQEQQQQPQEDRAVDSHQPVYRRNPYQQEYDGNGYNCCNQLLFDIEKYSGNNRRRRSSTSSSFPARRVPRSNSLYGSSSDYHSPNGAGGTTILTIAIVCLFCIHLLHDISHDIWPKQDAVQHLEQRTHASPDAMVPVPYSYQYQQQRQQHYNPYPPYPNHSPDTPYQRTPSYYDYDYPTYNYEEPTPEPIKPWESTPPKPIPLMTKDEGKGQSSTFGIGWLWNTNSNNNNENNEDDMYKAMTRHRHECIRRIRKRQDKLLGKFFFHSATQQGQEREREQRILLVDPAYHSNVGDHMLTLGEIEFVQSAMKMPSPPEQCHYCQAGGFYESCTDVLMRMNDEDKSNSDKNDDLKKNLALWHAGGNWGDLWPAAQAVRIPSFKTILKKNFRIIGMPQSLYYQNGESKVEEIQQIKEKIAIGLGLAADPYDDFSNMYPWQGDGLAYQRRLMDRRVEDDDNTYNQGDATDHEMAGMDETTTISIDTSKLDTKEGRQLAQSRVILTWRERESYEEAKNNLYPFVTNLLVPDIAFQLGPYQPIRHNNHNDGKRLQVDIILLLRDDLESKVIRDDEYVRSILPPKKKSISSSSTSKTRNMNGYSNNNKSHNDDDDRQWTFHIVDWKDRLDMFDTYDSFFTDTAIELLSLGKIVICDRLHAAILSYLAGLPFVYIDQVSGKITKTLSVAFDSEQDDDDDDEGCGYANDNHTGNTIGMWSKATSLSEALTIATDMIQQYDL